MVRFSEMSAHCSLGRAGVAPVPRLARPLDSNSDPTADRFRWMVESAGEVVFEADPEGRWTYLNPAWTRLLGHPVAASIGASFLDYVHPEDRQSNLDVFIETVSSGKEWCRFEARYLLAEDRPDADPAVLALGYRHMEIHAWIFRDGDGTPLGSTGTLTDVTARRRAEAELERRATHDPLTGLPNRALLAERVIRSIESTRANGHSTALLFLDLDRFKLVNDSLGHDVGDQVLRTVADRLRLAAGSDDLVARFGGDEFVLLADGVTATAAVDLAQRLRWVVSAPIAVDGHSLSLTSSIGLRVIEGAESAHASVDAFAKDVLRDADSAMYFAKDVGRDRVELFDAQVRRRLTTRLDTESRLRSALGRGELLLEYQPQVDLDGGEVVGLESLLRWIHPARGLLPPAEFIPVAEESGVIVPIGRWALEQVCTALAEAERSREPLPRVSINVSARQLARGYAPEVAAALAVTGAPPERLCIELTESAILADVEGARALMELADLGVVVSLDDFGTGFSSLAYLQRLPLHQLKIDRSFVARSDQASGRAILAAIVGIADALQLETIGEGVERPAQASFLRDLGCEAAQGYLYSRPLPLAEARRFQYVPPNRNDDLSRWSNRA